MFVKRSVPLAGKPLAGKSQPETANHTGVRPSIVNSKPVVSSGSRTLDLLLAHGGIPIGTCLAILEHGTTDFASSVIRAFCSYGIAEARSAQKTLVVVVGVQDFCKSLPLTVDVKTSSSSSNQTNVPDSAQSKRKIAWRYRPAHEPESKPSSYAPDLNYKTATVPRAQPNEVKYILGSNLAQLASELKSLLGSVDSDTVCRVVVPNMLHPAIYAPQGSSPKEVVPFLYTVRNIIASHRAALILSLPLQLYPFSHPVTVHIQQLMDACVELEPFENDKVQGFVHVLKLTDFTSRGIMVTRRQEYAFKLSKSQFEVSEWAIPVEVGEDEQEVW